MVKLVPLSNRNNEKNIYALVDKVFNSRGDPTKILTTEGTKFHGEFQKLCEKTLINHHMISQNHFEIDGSTKWVVHIYGETRFV
jgi:hypothetical protein